MKARHRTLPCLMACQVVWFFGCSMLPPDAPRELHEASAEIDSANQNDVSRYLPRTIQRAESSLEQARDWWLASERLSDKIAASDAKREALRAAMEAKQLARHALEAHGKIVHWDDNIDLFVAESGGDYSFSTLGKSVASGIADSFRAMHRRSMADSLLVSKTMAFFDSAGTELGTWSRENVLEVAALMKSRPDVRIVLHGYSDSTPKRNANNELARKRGEIIKEYLVQEGVAPHRIDVRVGREAAILEGSHSANRHFSRRVEATLLPARKLAE